MVLQRNLHSCIDEGLTLEEYLLEATRSLPPNLRSWSMRSHTHCHVDAGAQISFHLQERWGGSHRESIKKRKMELYIERWIVFRWDVPGPDELFWMQVLVSRKIVHCSDRSSAVRHSIVCNHRWPSSMGLHSLKWTQRVVYHPTAMWLFSWSPDESNFDMQFSYLQWHSGIISSLLSDTFKDIRHIRIIRKFSTFLQTPKVRYRMRQVKQAEPMRNM